MCTNAILRLQQTFFEKYGYETLFTSRFTQDCVENLFSVVRLKQKRPTPIQFRCHLRTIAISQYMQEVKNASYDMDDRKYLTGFMEYMEEKCKEDSIQGASDQSSMDCSLSMADHVDNASKNHSKTDVSSFAAQILSNYDNSETNALFHVAGYIVGTIGKNMQTCNICFDPCHTSAPFDKLYERFSNLLANARGKPFVYVSKPIFDFFVCMEFLVRQHLVEKQNIDRKAIKSIEIELKTLFLDIPKCHNLKIKMIRRFLQFKLKSDRCRKTRKRRFDSRSMLN